MSRSSLATALKNGQVRTVDFATPDLCGVLRGKRYNRELARKVLARGFSLPPSVYGMDAGGDPLNVRGIGIDDGDPDLQARILPYWDMQPWQKTPTAVVLCELLESDGKPCWKSPRAVLQAVVADFTRATGLRVKVAFEGEYFLIGGEPRSKKPPKRLATVATESTEVADVYGLNAFLPDNISARLWEQLQKTGLPLGALTHEAAAAQYEINLNPVDDPVAAADHWIFLRHAITSGAASLGGRATFCPKPFLNLPGSGLQINISLWDKQGRNCYALKTPASKTSASKTPASKTSASKARGAKTSAAKSARLKSSSVQGSDSFSLDSLPRGLRFSIAGLLRHNNSAMLYYAPHINAYRRYLPKQFAPESLFWNRDDRNAAVRLPIAEGDEARLEHRIASADANPYLVLAAVLTSIRLGLDEKREPPAPLKASGSVPRSFHRAWVEARRTTSFARAFGLEYHQLYTELKEAEYNRVLSNPVADEYSYYL